MIEGEGGVFDLVATLQVLSLLALLVQKYQY
jgi:hypothetical protein